MSAVVHEAAPEGMAVTVITGNPTQLLAGVHADVFCEGGVT